MKAPPVKSPSLLLAVVLILVGTSMRRTAVASQGEQRWPATPGDHAMLMAGGGATHAGYGETTEYVETIDVLVRHSLQLFSFGRDWWRFGHEWLVEIPFHYVIVPDKGLMVGANFLGCLTWQPSRAVCPYVFGGGGPIYVDADIPGVGADINGNYQFGLGVRARVNRRVWIAAEYRFHHVSNGNRVDPNTPLNSSKVLIGVGVGYRRPIPRRVPLSVDR